MRSSCARVVLPLHGPPVRRRRWSVGVIAGNRKEDTGEDQAIATTCCTRKERESRLWRSCLMEDKMHRKVEAKKV